LNEALTVIQTDHGEVSLSPAIVRKFLVNGQGNVTDSEITMFIALCKYQNLNPFLREAYLVKFGSAAATIVTGKEVFTKRASKIEKCEGWEAGITIINAEKKLERRTGTLVLHGEVLVGGWCKVYRKDWKVPVSHEVSMAEFDKKQSSWKTMPATMIRKVAIVSGLRDAFPEDFQGMYDSVEMPVDMNKLENNPVEINADILVDRLNKSQEQKEMMEEAEEMEEVANQVIDATKVAVIKGLLGETRSNETQFLKFYEIESVEAMTNEIFIKAMLALSKKKAAAPKTTAPILDI